MQKISVIICTHNPRKVFLQRVLNSLRSQTLPLNEWELLIVDNRSSSPVAEHFDFSWHPNVHPICEENLGLTPARLRGIKESSADILVFVDDDTVLAPDYLERTLKVAKQWPFIGAWGGSIIPEYECPLPTWIGQEVWRLTVVKIKEDVWSNLPESSATMPCGAGLCVRRIVAQQYLKRSQLNLTSIKLDRSGTVLSGYGDIDLAYCSFDLGLGTGNSTQLNLIHLIPATRLTLDYFIRHAEGDAISRMLFRANRGLPIPTPKPISWWQHLRWFFHRVKNHTPHEQYKISMAHQRGLLKGYSLVINNCSTSKKFNK